MKNAIACSFRINNRIDLGIRPDTLSWNIGNLEEEIKKLNDKGIVHAIRGKADLDEAAGAYKDISTVMNEQKDLVDIFVELEPMGVIKG